MATKLDGYDNAPDLIAPSDQTAALGYVSDPANPVMFLPRRSSSPAGADGTYINLPMVD